MKSIASKILSIIGGVVLIALVLVFVITATMTSKNMYSSENKSVQAANQKSITEVSDYFKEPLNNQRFQTSIA